MGLVNHFAFQVNPKHGILIKLFLYLYLYLYDNYILILHFYGKKQCNVALFFLIFMRVTPHKKNSHKKPKGNFEETQKK